MAAIFTETFGEAETVGDTQEESFKYMRWEKDGVEIVLKESYGMTSAEMTLIQ